MTLHDMIQLGVLGFLALVTIGSAIMVAATRRIMHAAFWLLPVFAGVAGFYLYLGAQFLAAIQVLIYIGAILVLILFAVTLTRKANDADARQSNRFVIPMVLSAFVMLAALVGAAAASAWGPVVANIDNQVVVPGVPVTDVSAIGVVLLQKYLLPFEIASVLLLAAMIGALVLARKERHETPEALPGMAVEERPQQERELAEV